MIRVLHSYLKLLSSVSSSEESVSFVGTYQGHFRLVLECWTDLILCRFCTGNHNYFEFMSVTVSSYPGGMFDITSSSSDLWILYDSLIIDWQKSSLCVPLPQHQFLPSLLFIANSVNLLNMCSLTPLIEQDYVMLIQVLTLWI